MNNKKVTVRMAGGGGGGENIPGLLLVLIRLYPAWEAGMGQSLEEYIEGSVVEKMQQCPGGCKFI